MKKLLMAVAAFGMLLTSCAKDDVVAPVEQKEALVSFCVNSPAVATRYGEGTTAQDLYYAVYDTQEGYVSGLSKVDGSVEINLSTTVNLNLVQGRSYEIIFWAQNENAPYTLTWGNAAAAEATMAINDVTALVANEEDYDAFYAYVEPFEVKGALSQTVELKRPFAQLNVATADTTLASTAGVDIATTGVEVKGVYSSFGFKDGAVIGDPVTATFAPTAKATGTIEANGKTYDHIAMNYLLVNDKELVDVTLTLAEDAAEGTIDLTRSYTSVPVQRNYRTNIVGNILTSPADFKVEIKPGFAEDDEIYDAPVPVTATVTVPEDNAEVEVSTATVTVTVPADAAQAGDNYQIVVSNESTETNATTGETTVAFDLTMYKNDVKVSGDVIYEVTINVGAGKIISEVKHNGTALTNATTGADQTYTYDSATGELTIYTASFSPFVITYADYKDYERKLNVGHNVNSTISVSTGADFLPIVAVTPEIYGYSVFDGNTRITDKVVFRFSDVKKVTIDENSYKVSFIMAVKDANGNDLTIKEGRMNPYIQTDPREYLNVYVNLLEVPDGYSVTEVKADNLSLEKTTRTDWPNTGEYMLLSNGISFQSKTAGLIEVTLAK